MNKINKVYVVLEGHYDDWEIVKVYKSKNKADKIVKELKEKKYKGSNCDWAMIEEAEYEE